MESKICDLLITRRFSEGSISPVYGLLDFQGLPSVMKIFGSEPGTQLSPLTGINELAIISTFDHPNVMPKIRLYTGLTCNTFSNSVEPSYSILIPHGVTSLSSASGGGLSDSSLRYMFDSLTGIAELHVNNILHLDIKSGNVILFGNGDVKVSDFGLSRFVPNVNDPQTIDEEVITRTYRPIEMLLNPYQGSSTISYASDIFSLGILFIELYSDLPARLYYLYADRNVDDVSYEDDPYSYESLVIVYNWLINTYIPSISDSSFKSILFSMLGPENERPTAQELMFHPFFTSRNLTATLNGRLIQHVTVIPERLSELQPLPYKGFYFWHAIDIFCRVTIYQFFDIYSADLIYDLCYMLSIQVYNRRFLTPTSGEYYDINNMNLQNRNSYYCLCGILEYTNGLLAGSSIYEKVPSSQLDNLFDEFTENPSSYLDYINIE